MTRSSIYSANTKIIRWRFLGVLMLAAQATHAFVSPRHVYPPTSSVTLQSYSRTRNSPLVVSTNDRKQTAIFGVASKGIELTNLLYDSTSTAFDAWEWTANLGAPAALIAIAVFETFALTREDHSPQKEDLKWVRVLKRSCRLLLFSSFVLELVSIFVSTVLGSVLLGHGECAAKKIVGYTSPLGLLRHHHEFEYLTIQITFLQGLYNWLAAVAIDMLIPREDETKSARRMNNALTSCTMTVAFWITAFYNNHLNFYSDYAHMLKRYTVLFFKTYFRGFKAFRPMSLLYGPSFLLTGALLWRACYTPTTAKRDKGNDSCRE